MGYAWRKKRERVMKSEKREREFKILFVKFTNEPKVYTKDVTYSLNRVNIKLFFCASEVLVQQNYIYTLRTYALDLDGYEPCSLGPTYDSLGLVSLKFQDLQLCRFVMAKFKFVEANLYQF